MLLPAAAVGSSEASTFLVDMVGHFCFDLYSKYLDTA